MAICKRLHYDGIVRISDKGDEMFLITAALLFVLFSLNVAMGSFGGAPVLGDVGEMLTLFASSVMFVAAILRRESGQKKNDGNQ